MNRREAIAALISLPEVARISAAPVKPKDVIVIECPGYLSSEAMAHIEQAIRQIWPDNKCVVLDASLKLKVVEGQ